MKHLVLATLFAALTLITPAMAVQPDEVLDDPVLEERARDISSGLRCLVCRNESIDESSADLARDLRLLVRERLVEGDTNDQTVDYIVARYGEYVLLRPTFNGSTIALWLAGPLLLLAGLGVSLTYVRDRAAAQASGEDGLSTDEQARLDAILADEPKG